MAGGWAIEANRYGRMVALAVLTLFGLALLRPGLAAAMSRPAAALGAHAWHRRPGSVQDGRLYQLIRQSGPISDRVFEIEFLSPGVRAYALTFG